MTPLNENQKLFLWLGILVIVAMGLYPPWKFNDGNPTSFGFLYTPPAVVGSPAVKLDISRLLIEWSLVGFVTAGLLVTAQTASGKNKNTKASEHAPERSLKQESPTKTASKTASKTAKTIKFPEITLGEVLVESADDPDYWEGIGEACGLVKIPAGSNVQLEVRKEKPLNLIGLKELDPHALQSIDFSESEVDDQDIAYLMHFNKLYEVDLSHTQIGDAGIEQLVKVTSLKKIWLDNTRITEASLDKLKALQGLTKVSLTGTDITEASVKSVKDAFPKNCEIIMASGIPA